MGLALSGTDPFRHEGSQQSLSHQTRHTVVALLALCREGEGLGRMLILRHWGAPVSPA